MILSVRLKNFRRYADALVEPGPGVTFLEGQNNAGKTTLLYAIEYALFGRVDGFRTLTSLMHPGSKAFGVEIQMKGRDGGVWKLQRVHALPPRSKSKLNGHFTLKHRPVAAEGAEASERYVLSSDFQDHEDALQLALQQAIGLTRRLFDVAVHMRQGEIARILEGDKRLDIVLGVTAAVISGDEARGLALDLEKESAALPVVQERLKSATTERDEVDGQLQASEAEASGLDERVRETERSIAELSTAESAFAPVRKSCAALATVEEGARDAWRRLREEEEALAARVAAEGDRAAVEATLAGQAARADQIAGDLERIRAERSSAEEIRRGLDRAHGDAEGRIARRERLLTASDGPAEARCEACGGPVDVAHARAELDAWKAEIAELEAKISEHARVASERTATERSWADEERNLALARSDRERYLRDLGDREKRVAERKVVCADRDAEARRAADETRAAAVAAGLALPEGAPVRSGVEDALLAATTDITRRLAQGEAALVALRDTRQRGEQERGRLRARRSDLEREITGLNQQVVTMTAKIQRAERLRRMSEAFKHLQGALRERASVALARDTHELHRSLSGRDEFEKVSLDPSDYSLHVVARDIGEEAPAWLFEGGGHRLLLGLAFRLAVIRLVGGSPFALLDEPTYGLDVAHRETLLQRVTGLGAIGQVLLVTHESMGAVGGTRFRSQRQGTVSVVSPVTAEVSP